MKAAEQPSGEEAGPPPTTPAQLQRLEAFSDTDEAQRLAVLEADRELIDQLVFTNYRGPEWEAVAKRLVGYGLRVISSWIRSGQIWLECSDRGYALERAPRASREEAHDLAVDTVTLALERFRDTVLIPRKWDPTRGANLGSYFIGQCVMRYPNFHRKRLAELSRRPPTVELVEVDVEVEVEAGPEVRAIRRLEQVDHLRDVKDPRTRAVLVYRSEGYPWDEIAVLLDMTVAGAKSLLHRHKQQIRRSKEQT